MSHLLTFGFVMQSGATFAFPDLQGPPERVWGLLHYTLLILAVIAVVGIVLAIIKFRMRSRLPAAPADIHAVSNASEVEGMLRRLMESDGRIDFRFADADGHEHQETGTVIQVDGQGLVFEWFTSHRHNIRGWAGRKLECAFRSSQGKFVQHNIFVTVIREVEAAGGDRLHIKAPLPATIGSGQKRATLRIRPPEEALLSMAIWPVEGTELPRTQEELGEPALVHVAGNTSLFSLDDISAGGIRIRLPEKSAEFFPAPLEEGGLFYFLVTLRDETLNENPTYLTLCSIRNVRPLPAEGCVILGCQFLARAQQPEDAPGTFVWRRMESNAGIAALSNWIFKSHLAMYQKRGLDISR